MKISILTLTLILISSSFSWCQIQEKTWTPDVFLPDNTYAGVGGIEDIIMPHLDFRPDTEGNFRYYNNPKRKIKVYGELRPEFNFSNAYGELNLDHSGYLEGKFRFNTFNYTSRGIAGFAFFGEKNIVIETSLHLLPYYNLKWRQFAYGGLYNSREKLTELHLGMRLFFNNQYEEQTHYSPSTYLKRGSFTFGVDGYYPMQLSFYGHYAYEFVPHISFFLLDRLAVGTTFNFVESYSYHALGMSPSIEYYLPISPKLQIVPSLESYLNASTISLIADGDLGAAFNLGIKANYFIGENLSIWAGPFFSQDTTRSSEYRLNLKGGFKSYVMSKRNR